MNYQQPELQQHLAGEYVLGTLQGAARRRFEQLLVADAGLRRYVEAWERRLHPWLAAVPAVPVPERVWQQIRIRLGHVPASRGRAGLWRWFGLGSSALAIALAAVLVLRPRELPVPPPVTPVYRDIAVLNSEQAEAVWVVRTDAANRTLTLSSLVPVNVPSDRDLELWSIPAGGAPLSLGLLVLQADGTAILALSDVAQARRAQGAVLAISLEPRGGSPTGAPTGPVLYTGRMHS